MNFDKPGQRRATDFDGVEEIEGVIGRSLDQQRDALLDMPQEIKEAIAGILKDIKNNLSSGRAPYNASYGLMGEEFNVIPSTNKSRFFPTLVTYCYDKDVLDERIMESLNFVVNLCPDICQTIYVLTTQWNSYIANHHLMGYIESVRCSGVNIFFIHITSVGIALMPA